MLHAYIQIFDVIGGRENILDLYGSEHTLNAKTETVGAYSS
jgi:hypothetical protein